MRRYELTFIVNPDISEDIRDQIFDKVKSLIEQEKGLIVNFDEWGQKKLAYEIRKKTRGYYTCINFCGTPALVDELERSFRLDDKILKYMTILLDKQADLDAAKAEIEENSKAPKQEAVTDDTTSAQDTSDEETEAETTETISEEEEV